VRRGRAGVYVKHLILRLARPAPEDSGGGQQGGEPETILPSRAFSCKCKSQIRHYAIAEDKELNFSLFIDRRTLSLWAIQLNDAGI
jgi:hypothetical protein